MTRSYLNKITEKRNQEKNFQIARGKTTCYIQRKKDNDSNTTLKKKKSKLEKSVTITLKH